MLTTIARYSFPHEAQLARCSLEAAGIPAFIADEHTINMQWLYSDAMGGVRLQVPPEHAGQALALLATDFSDSLPEHGLPAEQAGHCCPHCGSDELDLDIRGKRWAFLVFLALHFPLWPFRRQWLCRQCGHAHRYSRHDEQNTTTAERR